MDYLSHWNQVYSTKSAQEVSWYQPHAKQSLTLIERIAAGRPSRGAIQQFVYCHCIVH